jgi:hypothetical protein
MPGTPLLPQTPLQRQLAQMALEYAAKLEQAAAEAPAGRIASACEDLALDQGRQFLRDSLAATLQAQIDEAEKKGAPFAPVPAATAGAIRAAATASS